MVLIMLSDVLLETDLFVLPLNTGLSYYYTYGRPYIHKLPLSKRGLVPHSEVYDIPEPRNPRNDRVYDVYPSDGYHDEQDYVDFNHQEDYNVYYPSPPPEPQMPEDVYLHLPQYVKTAMLFILGMTLFLFFASGMYSEKVGYANKYVLYLLLPHIA